MSDQVKPELPGGFRDYLPEEALARERLVEVVSRVCRNFGFVPLETPGVERKAVLTRGDEGFKNIFGVTDGRGGEALALRFDLTVPLARVVAQYREELPRPWRRYQVGNVWRSEKPQAGRYREFRQFDADIVGTDSVVADAEIVALMTAVMSALGFATGEFCVRLNNRKVLNGLWQFAKFGPDRTVDVLRVLDKLDKVGWDEAKGELSRSPEDPSPGLGMKPSQIEAIERYVQIGQSSTDPLSELRDLLTGSREAQTGIDELLEIEQALGAMNVPREAWKYDMTMARGLGYYTGPIFETVLTARPELGSVYSGGRYDGLVGQYSEYLVPATGASLGFDRLCVELRERGLLGGGKTPTQVMALNFDPSCRGALLRLLAELRAVGIASEIYLGREDRLGNQLREVVKLDIPVVLVMGGRELERGVVAVRTTANRQQVDISISEAVERIKALLV